MTATAAERVPLNPTLLASLRQRLGDRVSTSAAVCAQHGKDESYHAAHAPDAVAFVRSTDEVAQVVRLCAAHGVPVIPYGTGTSLEGHVAALQGGVSIDMSQMRRVVRIMGGGTYARHSPFGFWFEDVRALGFLRPPWTLAYDALIASAWPDMAEPRDGR